MQIENEDYWILRQKEDSRKDWRDNSDWIKGYWNSRSHPHRQLIIEALKNIEFNSLLEVGSSCGPNLFNINNNFPNKILAGIDLNPQSIIDGDILMKLEGIENIEFKIGNAKSIPYTENSFDVVLADAVLMYVDPEGIRKAIDEMTKVARKAVIIIDWDNDSLLGELDEFHWCRNYKKLLEEYNFKVTKTKIPKDLWDSKNWEKLGHIWVATYQAV